MIFERNQLLPATLWCVNSNIVTEIPINDTIYTCILKHNDTISGLCYADIKFGKSIQQFSGKW